MKIAILSEAPADEAAIRILVGALLGREAEPVAGPHLRSRGWQSTMNVLPAVLKHLHYQTDAQGLVVIVDSDSSPVHEDQHDTPGGADPKCRICRLVQIAQATVGELKDLPGREAVRIAFGQAVPAIEAWYRCGIDSRVTEFAWKDGLRRGGGSYSVAGLKRDVYGSDRPGLDLLMARAVEEATRLTQELDRLEADFPYGFGLLAREVRGWITP